jgi:hypothetical protein
MEASTISEWVARLHYVRFELRCSLQHGAHLDLGRAALLPIDRP